MAKLGTQRYLGGTRGKLTQQVGVKPYKQAPTPQPQQVIPEGYLTKADVTRQLTLAYQEVTNVERQRSEEYKQLQSGLMPGENIGSSQLRNFNRKWNIRREQANRKVTALKELQNQIGNKYISQASLNQYVAGSSSGVERDLRLAESYAKQRQDVRTYEGLVETYGETLSPQEIVKLTPSQLKVAGLTQADVDTAKESVKYQTGTYISPEGYGMSISPEAGIEKVKLEGGDYYGEEYNILQKLPLNNLLTLELILQNMELLQLLNQRNQNYKLQQIG